MPTETIIEAENLSKAYRIWKNPSARLKSPMLEAVAHAFPDASALRNQLQKRAQRGYRDFYALKSLSLQIRRGEALGIIGRNGSGKSTLLQLIAGTLTPTTGSLAVRGRVSALLELGSGFNPEFTGRENVFINGAILGLSREQMQARFDAIAEFSEIGEFIEQPVKTYSSGMVMRLAFAVAAHVDPDILIVDEALSVGDARFQLKCARAIDRFIAQGVTLLFVSHDASLVKRLCHRAILLDHGNVVYEGVPNDVVNLYSKLTIDGNTAESLQADIAALRDKAVSQKETKKTKGEDRDELDQTASSSLPSLSSVQNSLSALHRSPSTPHSSTATDPRSAALLSDERENVPASGHEFAYGGELGRIRSVLTLGPDGQPRTTFQSGEQVTARIVVECYDDCPDPILALTIKNASGVEIYGTNTLFSKQPAPRIKAGESREVDFTFPINLMAGEYFLSFGFTHFVGDKLVVLQRRYDAIKLSVDNPDRTFGIANLHAKITTRPLV